MFFVAWAINPTIARQGGVRGLQRATPLSMGLILGEFAVGGVWGVIGVVTQTRTFSLTAW